MLGKRMCVPICMVCHRHHAHLFTYLECKKCFGHVYLDCLESGPPGGLHGDNFYRYVCNRCGQGGKPSFTRKRMEWLSVVLLAMYNLHLTSDSQDGFFHWRLHVCNFILTNWDHIFPGTNPHTVRSNWRGAVSKELSQHSSSLFVSGVDEIGQSGWWKLKTVAPPAELMNKNKPTCVSTRCDETSLSPAKKPKPDQHSVMAMMPDAAEVEPPSEVVEMVQVKEDPTMEVEYVYVGDEQLVSLPDGSTAPIVIDSVWGDGGIPQEGIELEIVSEDMESVPELQESVEGIQVVQEDGQVAVLQNIPQSLPLQTDSPRVLQTQTVPPTEVNLPTSKIVKREAESPQKLGSQAVKLKQEEPRTTQPVVAIQTAAPHNAVSPQVVASQVITPAAGPQNVLHNVNTPSVNGSTQNLVLNTGPVNVNQVNSQSAAFHVVNQQSLSQQLAPGIYQIMIPVNNVEKYGLQQCISQIGLPGLNLQVSSQAQQQNMGLRLVGLQGMASTSDGQRNKPATSNVTNSGGVPLVSPRVNSKLVPIKPKLEPIMLTLDPIRPRLDPVKPKLDPNVVKSYSGPRAPSQVSLLKPTASPGVRPTSDMNIVKSSPGVVQKGDVYIVTSRGLRPKGDVVKPSSSGSLNCGVSILKSSVSQATGPKSILKRAASSPIQAQEKFAKLQVCPVKSNSVDAGGVKVVETQKTARPNVTGVKSQSTVTQPIRKVRFKKGKAQTRASHVLDAKPSTSQTSTNEVKDNAKVVQPQVKLKDQKSDKAPGLEPGNDADLTEKGVHSASLDNSREQVEGYSQPLKRSEVEKLEKMLKEAKIEELPKDQCKPMSSYEELQLVKDMEACPKFMDVDPEIRRYHRKLALRMTKRQLRMPVFNIDQLYARLKASRDGTAGASSEKNQLEDSKSDGEKDQASSKSNGKSRVLDRFQCNITDSEVQNQAVSYYTRLVGSDNLRLIFSPYSNRKVKPIIYQDYETSTPRMRLMDEILSRTHKVLPPRQPITYCHLRSCHVQAVNCLTQEFFWGGIDVSECLQYPDYTCVALYRKLVVGFAFLVPDTGLHQAYLSFLFTRPDWQRAGIATFMMSHLIKTCYNRDITLHVAATNPAVLFYQSFGFKAEEVAFNFYDKYMWTDKNHAKHAYFMRRSR